MLFSKPADIFSLKLVFDTNFSLIFATIPAQKTNAKYKFKSANKAQQRQNQ